MVHTILYLKIYLEPLIYFFLCLYQGDQGDQGQNDFYNGKEDQEKESIYC